MTCGVEWVMTMCIVCFVCSGAPVCYLLKKAAEDNTSIARLFKSSSACLDPLLQSSCLLSRSLMHMTANLPCFGSQIELCRSIPFICVVKQRICRVQEQGHSTGRCHNVQKTGHSPHDSLPSMRNSGRCSRLRDACVRYWQVWCWSRSNLSVCAC